MTDGPQPFTVGWAEWVKLPDLGVPAIRAKIDTGARTSALDAFEIEPFGPADAPMVRFGLHPIAGRADVAIYCSAPVVDRLDLVVPADIAEEPNVARLLETLADRHFRADAGNLPGYDIRFCGHVTTLEAA